MVPHAFLAACLAALSMPLANVHARHHHNGPPYAPKVLIIGYFEGEQAPFVEPFGLTRNITVPGMPVLASKLKCNEEVSICHAIFGMGHANAAASAMAVAFTGVLDLRKTYVLIAGVAGISPEEGTLGTAAWARWVGEWSLQHEIDAREKPSNWSTGYWGLFTTQPGEKPAFDYTTELFRADEALLQKALMLSEDVELADGDAIAEYRSRCVARLPSRMHASRVSPCEEWCISWHDVNVHGCLLIQAGDLDSSSVVCCRYTQAAATTKPQVVQCDTLAGDTWFTGA